LKLAIIVTLGFRKGYEKAANWLRQNPWSSLFLGLPVESEPFVKAYAEKRFGEKEFWSNITLLTGHAKPFINSLKLRFQPILDGIRGMHADKKEIHCFQDLKSCVEESKIQERILLLQFRYRATGKLDLNMWKGTLLDEMKALEDSWRRATDRILEEADEDVANVVIHGGYLKSIEQLKRPNSEVEIILLEEYWKSPLDTLRTMLWRHGFDKVSDREMGRYLEMQKKYVDLVIRSKDVDKAHEEWTQTVRNYVYTKG